MNRTRWADQKRGHPDDQLHRVEVRDVLRAAWRASGMNGKHWSFDSNNRDDWKASSVQRWGDQAHFAVRFVFEGLEQHIPEELKEGPDGETFHQQRIRAKWTVRKIREALGLSKLEMDRRLDQQYCAYHSWESRMTDFNLAAMQRTVRALGGVFKVELMHRHNPGLLRRLNKK